MKKQIENFLDKYKKELREAGEVLENESIPELTEELFSMYEKTGNRIVYEKVYFTRRKFLSVFGVLSILYARKKDIAKLEEVIVSICEEECWALPAHVDRRGNDNWRITIDLFAAETAFYLADIIGRMGDMLSMEVRSRARQEVFARVLNPFMESEKPYAWWEKCQMNWCAVCNGSIGGAAIWLMEPSVRLDNLLTRICARLKNYIDGFSEDGVCLEGLSYYTYGMNFYVAFAELMYNYSEMKTDLLEYEKLNKIAKFQEKCFLAGGRTICFADGDSRDTFRMGITAYLAMHYKDLFIPDFDMAAQWDSDDCYRYLMISRDIFFTEKYLESLDDKCACDKEKCGQVIFENAEWSISTSRNGNVLACKGGNNDEPHNHNDVGSFFYIVQGEMILADLGAGEYTRQYFDEHRYEQLSCRSLGHNVPIIDGMEQQAGEKYRAAEFRGNRQGETIIELGDAYDLDEKESIKRTLRLDMDTGELDIEDTFSLNEGRRITENLVTTYEPHIIQSGFRIETERGCYEIICSEGENFRIEQQPYRDHKGVERTVWLMQWDEMNNE